jgi:hypothetical protein
LRIEILTASAERDYHNLVARAPASPLSHTLIWRDVLLELGVGEPVYWLAYDGTQLVGALPAFVRRTQLGAVLNSLPFVQSTGGIISNANTGPAKRAELVKILIDTMLDWCRANKVCIACVIGSAFTGEQDFDAMGVQPDFRAERLIRAIDLVKPLEYRPSVHGAIKKAQEYNPAFKQATSLEQARLVYQLYADSMRQINVEPHGWGLYQRIYTESVDKGCARFVWAEVDGEPVAGIINMRHGGIMDYFSMGSTDFGRRIQASSWLCNKQIHMAAAAGARWWNWMASPTKQVYDFKKRWGGMDRKYPIYLWRLGEVSSWQKLSPAELSAQFPGHFVLPYAWLSSADR